MPTGLGDEQLWLSATNDNTGTSTAFNDQSGNGNDGTASGTLVVADTSEGGTYAFNLATVSHSVSLPADLGISGDTMSISLWVNNSSSNVGSSVDAWFGAYDSTNANSNLFVYQFNSDFRYADKNTSPNTTITDTWSASPASAWRHITVVADGTAGEYRAYENGVLLNTQSSGGSDMTIQTSLNWIIGSGNGWVAAIGKLDDIRAYGRVLTQAEIVHLAEARGIEGPPPAGLGDEKLWLCPSINDSANDISGNGNNGTYQGGMGTVADTGEGGSYAYDFDGVNDYIDCDSILGGLTEFSLNCWVKPTDGDAYQHFIQKQYLNNDEPFVLKVRGQDNKLSVESTDNNGTQLASTSSTSPLPDVQWSHLCGQLNGNTYELYIDGVLVASTTYFPSVVGGSNGPVLIGAGLGASVAGYTAGLMDDVRIFDRALTQAEIVHLAEARGIEGPPPVGLGDEKLWLCPSINDSANDISGNGNNGTYNGGMGTVADTGSGGTLAYDFDGIDDTITTASAVQFGADSFSISLWMYSSANFNNSPFGNYAAGSTSEWVTVTTQGGRDIFLRLDDGSTNVSTVAQEYSNLAWHTHTFVVNRIADGSGSIVYYRDGAEITNASIPVGYGSIDSNAVFSIGNSLNGMMDDIRVYKRILTQAEIGRLTSSRGVEGPAPVGLGDEKLWLCPSLNDSASDISGNGNDGTYQGGMATVADTSNGGTLAYDFDGVDDGIQVYNNGVNGGGGAADFLGDGTFSVSLWYQTSIADTGVTGFPMWGTRERGGYYGYSGGMRPLSNNGRWRYRLAKIENFSLTQDLYEPPSPNDANWHHVCWSSTAGVAALYIDGVLVDTLSVGTISPEEQTSLYFGKGLNFDYANGLMDDIRMYDRTLTQAEITHLATSRGIEGSPSGPPVTPDVFYNPFKSQAFHTLIGQRIR